MINYTLKQLYSFEAVIRLSSFTKASKELNITQPAVYMQIQQLQKNIGSYLVNIKGKSIHPTFIGKKLYQTCLEVINKLEQTKSDIEQTLDPDSGHLQIAVATTTNSFISRVLAKFKRQYPKMTFHLEVTNRKLLLEKLNNNETDLVVMGEPPSDMPLITQPFMENPLIAIVHPKHPLLANNHNTIKTLMHETLITREQGSGTRITIERITGMQFNSNIEINSNEVTIKAVQAGLGIGFVSKHTVKLELQSGIIKQLNVEKFPITRHWHVVHNNNKLSPIAKRFKAFIIASS
ncbi:transcriptional regulator, LysR family [Abyssogena phaseoliformis symbiont OG214]|uniref:LysR family transcriptional regulator n=1 Tax=Abyssogena phaseoliformis symbiont TaxID=596095 RepID=UPI001916315B|nr:LysR family transcriptional regulator [Abyssogena phaseoliformis symbiont]MBW5288977.1 RuBisCO operon transcriptional regulator CbbR [Candidatus Ruthia sp. Apha_13_S6]BBB22835.1 transcriptional regulator, LysR family [Abyssogena phaseoliformis symbiont OG214]